MILPNALCLMASAPQKRKHVILTIQEKLDICQHAKDRDTPTVLANECNIRKSTAHDIIKSEDKLQQFQFEIDSTDCIKKR